MPNPGNSITRRLEALVAEDRLQRDERQMAIAARLDRVAAELTTSRAQRKTNALGWLFAARRQAQPPLRGLYIYGGVGRGKTMLMDLFFETVPIERKRRAHFHAFMADVQERIFRHRQRLKAGETREVDPMPPVAAEIYGESRLLCFDEFTVTDIADAMILSRLFTELFARGCVLVATSNVAPDDLYRDGLNRGLFLPFIGLLKQHADVVCLDSETDYRMEKTEGIRVWNAPLNETSRKAFEEAWLQFTAGHAPAPATVPMKGREITVPLAAGRAARFGFADLCQRPLGATDYLALLAQYDTLFVEGVPRLSADRRNEVKRLILLVDTVYDKGGLIIATAESAPDALLLERRGTEGFEFDRTISRLTEMQSSEYREAHRQHHQIVTE
ncbi:cell division protein ZapE [Xaviernesmea oryzae]|uniref:Cell division protein ZapE n=1 Tax=Xaviernesmea oryzae TaxID=464029 RepID=A0A1Q9AVX0_9HYPH|nr:cell division protein ZapE [Xaviernesmea oryzae]OLP59544.1 cell division protein ZapE [Xaviernesmea oryzae]SEM13911.1 cell division protein ZapE [Xaviernesmea oryzae]